MSTQPLLDPDSERNGRQVSSPAAKDSLNCKPLS